MDECQPPPSGAPSSPSEKNSLEQSSEPKAKTESGSVVVEIGFRRRGGAKRGGRDVQSVPHRRHLNRPVIELTDLWTSVRPERTEVDRAFLPGALRILETPASTAHVRAAYILCLLVSAGVIWACIGHLDVYADATGIVQPSGNTKVVQPITSGRIIAFAATDGRKVKAGDVLVQLDPTSAIAERNVLRNQLIDTRAEVIRLEAEIRAATTAVVDTNPKVVWPPDLPASVTDREQDVLRTDLSSFSASISSLQAQKKVSESDRNKYADNIAPQSKVISLMNEHLGMDHTMQVEGWNSRLNVLTEEQQLQTAQLQLINLQGSLAQANAQIQVLASQIASTKQDFITKATGYLVKSEENVDELEQKLIEAEETVSNTRLSAPVDGTIEGSGITTVGQTVLTGQQLMQIVPDATPLEITAYVLNTDIGFINVGQAATIKVDSFDFTRYGTISGHITKIAADAMPGKEALSQQKDASAAISATGSTSVTSAAQQTSDLVFPVTIKPDRPGLLSGGQLLPLTSGMTVTVEIRTESRRAINYILAPLQSMFL